MPMPIKLKSSDYSRLIVRLNVYFVAIALIVLELCRLIFPALYEKVNSFGSVLPPVFNFFSAQCVTVGNTPFVYLVACSIYYGVSLRAFKPETNVIINIALLFYLVLLMLSLGGPFMFVPYPEYRSVTY